MKMFTVFGIHPDGHEDGYTDLPTLQEALTHLREVLEAETPEEHGPVFARYGLSFDHSDAKAVVQQLRGLAA